MIKKQISFFIKDTYTGTAGDPLSLNLYTYCANNPIKYEDSNGHAFTLVTGLIGAVAGLAIGAGSSMIADYFTGNLSKNNWKKYLGAGVQGAVVGGVAGLTGGLSLGVPAMIGTGAASGAVGNVLNQAIRNDGFKDFSKKELVVSTISSGVGFGVAGATSSGITNMTNQISSQTLQSTVQGATMGAIGGASGGFSANVTDQVWDIKTNKKDSFDVGSLIKDTFVGGVVGAGIGGAFGFGSSKFGTKINDLDKKVNESIKQGANKFVDSSKTMFKKLITDETGSIRIGLIDPKDSSSTGVANVNPSTALVPYDSKFAQRQKVYDLRNKILNGEITKTTNGSLKNSNGVVAVGAHKTDPSSKLLYGISGKNSPTKPLEYHPAIQYRRDIHEQYLLDEYGPEHFINPVTGKQKPISYTNYDLLNCAEPDIYDQILNMGGRIEDYDILPIKIQSGLEHPACDNCKALFPEMFIDVNK